MTEFAERGALSDVLNNHAISLDFSRCLGFAQDAAKGMSFLHSLEPPLLHRCVCLFEVFTLCFGSLANYFLLLPFSSDLKSANILIMADWSAKVTDFGTARLYHQAKPEPPKGGSKRFLAKRKAKKDALAEEELSRSEAHMTTSVGTPLWTAP